VADSYAVATHVRPSAPIKRFSYRFVSPSNVSGLNTTSVWDSTETKNDAFANATSKAKLDPAFHRIGTELANPFGACCSRFSEHAPTTLAEDGRLVPGEAMPRFGCSLAVSEVDAHGTFIAVGGEGAVMTFRLGQTPKESSVTRTIQGLASEHNSRFCVHTALIGDVLVYLASRALHMVAIGSVAPFMSLSLPAGTERIGRHFAASPTVIALSVEFWHSGVEDNESVVVFDKFGTTWRTTNRLGESPSGFIGSLGVSSTAGLLTVGRPGASRVDVYRNSGSGWGSGPVEQLESGGLGSRGGFAAAQRFEGDVLAVGQHTGSCWAYLHVFRYAAAQQQFAVACRELLVVDARRCNVTTGTTMSISAGVQHGTDTLFTIAISGTLQIVKVASPEASSARCAVVSSEGLGDSTPSPGGWAQVAAMTNTTVVSTRVGAHQGTSVSHARFCGRDYFKAREAGGWWCQRCPSGQFSGGGIARTCTPCDGLQCPPRQHWAQAGTNHSQARFEAQLNASMLLHGEHYQVEIAADSSADQRAVVRSPGFSLDLTAPVTGQVLDGKATVAAANSNSSNAQSPRNSSSVRTVPAVGAGEAHALCMDYYGPLYCQCSARSRARQRRDDENLSLEEFTRQQQSAGDGDQCVERRGANETERMCNSSSEFARNCRATCGNCTRTELQAQNGTLGAVRTQTEVVCVDCEDVTAQTNTTDLGCRWSGFFDEESDVVRFFAGFGTAPETANVVPLVDVGMSLDFAASNLSLQHSTTYFCVVHAENGAGARASASSDGVIVDLTPPQMEYVNDGLQPGVDVDTQTFQDAAFGNWRALDNESAIVDYEWAVGTSANATDIMNFESVAAADRYGRFDLDLPQHARLYVTARATNAAGLRSAPMTSNGIQIGKGEIMLQPTEETVVMFDTQKVSAASKKAKVGVNTSETTDRANNVPEEMREGKPVLGALVSPPGAVGSATRLVAGALSDTELASGQQSDPAGQGERLADPANATSPRAPPRNFRYGSYSFAIRAYDEDKKPLRSFHFEKPVTLSIYFDVDRLLADDLTLDGEARALQTPSIMLFSEVHDKWMLARDTCDPPVWHVNYTTSMYTVHVCHLTQFALFFQSKPVAKIEGCPGSRKIVHLPRGHHLQFDAQGSFDADGAVERYDWTRPRGTADAAALSFARPQQLATAVHGAVEGTHVFKLTVTDNDLATGEAECEVQVVDSVAPVRLLACGNENSRRVKAAPPAPMHLAVHRARWYPYYHNDPTGRFSPEHRMDPVGGHGAAVLVDRNSTTTELVGAVNGRNYTFVLEIEMENGLVYSTYYALVAEAPGDEGCPNPLSSGEITAIVFGSLAVIAIAAMFVHRRLKKRRDTGFHSDIIECSASGRGRNWSGWGFFDGGEEKKAAHMDNPMMATAQQSGRGRNWSGWGIFGDGEDKKTAHMNNPMATAQQRVWSKKQAEAIDRGEAPPPPRDLSQASSVDEWGVFDDTDDAVVSIVNPMTGRQTRTTSGEERFKATRRAYAEQLNMADKPAAAKRKQKVKKQFLQRLSGRRKRAEPADTEKADAMATEKTVAAEASDTTAAAAAYAASASGDSAPASDRVSSRTLQRGRIAGDSVRSSRERTMTGSNRYDSARV
jgi:hypothetical protein